MSRESIQQEEWRKKHAHFGGIDEIMEGVLLRAGSRDQRVHIDKFREGLLETRHFARRRFRPTRRFRHTAKRTRVNIHTHIQQSEVAIRQITVTIVYNKPLDHLLMGQDAYRDFKHRD